MDNPNNLTSETLPTGTVTFLFSDIEGSTALAQQYPEAMPGLLKQHHGILSTSIQAHHGQVFQIIGDAFCAAFHTAEDALEAALEAQRRLQHTPWDPATIAVRMGIHTGAAQAIEVNDISGGYSGYLSLACTQAVMSSAHGGQALISGASAELLRGHLPADIQLRDMGEHHLKGGLDSEHLWQLVASDLRVEFPPLKTLSVIPNNLPAQLNSFIGREHELAETQKLLSSTHLLTLIGPGGTGKSRLTIQLAGEVLPDYPDGTWLVELAPLADPRLVLQTIAAALGLHDLPGTTLKDLVTNFLHHKHTLLLLDNCEHLVETCAQIADYLLRSCPNVKIIASSREALGIAGETVYRVPSLTLPDSDNLPVETLLRSEAVQLFIERAAAVKTGFILTDHNATAVIQVCRRLDGIPLALELAAARLGMLTPEQIATRLDDRFRLLTGGSRSALPRQQTLRSLIDWSYDLLSEPERDLICHLAVFMGGWSLEAAEAICPDLDVLELLNRLVQKSLVVVEDHADTKGTRFRLLETIRQYARDRLLERGKAEQARDRHMNYFLNLVEARELDYFGPNRLEWMDQCELENDNFRAALQWGLDHDAESTLRLSASLAVFWGGRGLCEEGQRWLQTALERVAAQPEPEGESNRHRQPIQAKGLYGLSQVSYGLGDYQNGFDASQEAVRLYRQLGDPINLGVALCSYGNMAAFQNNLVLAEQALQEAIAIGREIRHPAIICYATGVMGEYVSIPHGNLSEARDYCDESMRAAKEIHFPWGEALGEVGLARIAARQEQWDVARQHALKAIAIQKELRDVLVLNQTYSELGDIELRAGNYPQAQAYYRQCILIWLELGQRAFTSHTLESFAFIARAQNQPERTAHLLAAAEAVREGIKTTAIGVGRLETEYEKTLAWLHTRLNEAAYDACWSEGCSLTLDQAVAYALEA